MNIYVQSFAWDFQYHELSISSKGFHSMVPLISLPLIIPQLIVQQMSEFSLNFALFIENLNGIHCQI